MQKVVSPNKLYSSTTLGTENSRVFLKRPSQPLGKTPIAKTKETRTYCIRFYKNQTANDANDDIKRTKNCEDKGQQLQHHAIRLGKYNILHAQHLQISGKVKQTELITLFH